jgi:peptide/nickel transport system permease protein
MASALIMEADPAHEERLREAPRRGRAVRRFLQRPAGVVALVILVLCALCAYLGPLVYHVSPTDTNALATNLAPSRDHLFGTDELGRDELARLLAGGQLSFAVGLFSVLISIGVGSAVGLVAGFLRGVAEMVLMRLIDTAMAIPAFFLILFEITVYGNAAPVLIAVIGFTYWSQVARIMHGQVLSLREQAFVEASMALGASRLRIMIRHVLPHLYPSMLVMASLAVAWAILTESALSFLGLGIQPPDASWGSMLQNAQTYVFLDPMLAIIPGIFIAVTVLMCNILGDALRDLV